MMNYKKLKKVKVPEQKLVKDPRSAKVSNGAVNYIATGAGCSKRQKRMLARKEKKAQRRNIICGLVH